MEHWNQAQAIDLARRIEQIAPKYGCHVALTGGCLYKDGERKDVDILFYRIRQVEEIDIEQLFAALSKQLGVVIEHDYGWCVKARLGLKSIDLFFPERPGDQYPSSSEEIVAASELWR